MAFHILRTHAEELAIRRVTDLHCPIDNKQYKRMDIEHIDGTFTSLDIISIIPCAQPFVHRGNTILDPHCPTSRGMGKWWPNEKIYGRQGRQGEGGFNLSPLFQVVVLSLMFPAWMLYVPDIITIAYRDNILFFLYRLKCVESV